MLPSASRTVVFHMFVKGNIWMCSLYMVLVRLIGFKRPGNSFDWIKTFRTCRVCMLTRGLYQMDTTNMGRRWLVGQLRPLVMVRK